MSLPLWLYWLFAALGGSSLGYLAGSALKTAMRRLRGGGGY